MRTLDLSTRLLSEACWSRIIEHAAPQRLALGPRFYEQLIQLEKLRVGAQYNTGSISSSTQWLLFALSYYFQPHIVAEIGTFIGKSTVSISLGLDAALSVGAEVHTCDASNAMVLPTIAKTRIIQYPSTGSTQMFKDMVADDLAGKVDLLHIDGRLQNDDLELVERLASPNMLFVLDDFEGFEKGVANYAALRQHSRFKKHLLVRPASEPLLRAAGFVDHSSTALIVPEASIRLTSQ